MLIFCYQCSARRGLDLRCVEGFVRAHCCAGNMGRSMLPVGDTPACFSQWPTTLFRKASVPPALCDVMQLAIRTSCIADGLAPTTANYLGGAIMVGTQRHWQQLGGRVDADVLHLGGGAAVGRWDLGLHDVHQFGT